MILENRSLYRRNRLPSMSFGPTPCETEWTVRTHEEVIGIGHVSTNSEELHQVVKLSMNITAYLII